MMPENNCNFGAEMKPKSLLLAFFPAAFAMLLVYSCATVEKPGGGPRDFKAPTMVASSPADSSTQFQSQKIVIEFDEFVKLNNPASQVIVNPFPINKPDISVQGHKVKITLNDSLASNTTYHIFFGDAVQDITEGNKASGLNYVFSTGNYLDSCSAEGFIGDAFTNIASEKAWVLLYQKISDFTDTIPLYIAHSNNNGSFKFRNVAPGHYYICAIEDNNSNFRFDLPDEKIAFRAEPIVLSAENPSIDSLKLYLFVEKAKEQKHLKTEISGYQTVRSSFRLSMNNPEITLLSSAEKILYSWNKTIDTLTFWVKSPIDDTLKYIIRDGIFADTLSQNLKAKARIKTVTDTTFKLRSSVHGGILPVTEAFEISAIMPFEAPDTSNIIFCKNTDTIVSAWQKADSLGCYWKILAEFEPGDDCSITFKKGAVHNFFGFNNDSITIKFKVAGPEDLGSMHFTFTNRPNSKLILIAESKAMSRKIEIGIDSTEIVLENLIPGDYSVKIISDIDEDKDWTTGNFSELRQPEVVFTLARPIQVKKGWESKIGWSLKRE
jgi:uncharacterized protein (DUF2141 family)